ncbi:MAG TPA: hypothetical protein VMU59_12645 [Caulobacteraceae bacterium]|nr:hypothetical protein [Caulobacteraceae bacterium]
MACCSTDDADGGFATPAAVVVSLAMALTTTAVLTASVADLKLARAELVQAQTQNTLAGAQLQAWRTALGFDNANARARWIIADAVGPITVLAEAESAKTGLAAAEDLDDRAFAKLQITDLPDLKARLKALTPAQALGPALEQADASPIWGACARSLFSEYGLSKTVQMAPAQAPTYNGVDLHAGEVWRVRVSLPDGWTDDRLVRFRGDALNPAATLQRRYFKTNGESDPCDAVLNAS